VLPDAFDALPALCMQPPMHASKEAAALTSSDYRRGRGAQAAKQQAAKVKVEQQDVGSLVFNSFVFMQVRPAHQQRCITSWAPLCSPGAQAQCPVLSRRRGLPRPRRSSTC
jgi:hypothetical protein